MESLGYGTQLILDGFNADTEKLGDASIVTACLNEVAVLLEPIQSDTLLVTGTQGISAMLRLGESHLLLHTYTNAVSSNAVSSNALSLHLFSRHDMPWHQVSDLLKQHFGVRRVESFLFTHAKTLPQDTDSRKKVLLGDRAYSALRLDATL